MKFTSVVLLCCIVCSSHAYACDEVVLEVRSDGPGQCQEATDSPDQGLPDFITEEVQLTTENGTEKYEWATNERIKMHAWFSNIGDADWAGEHYDLVGCQVKLHTSIEVCSFL